MKPVADPPATLKRKRTPSLATSNLCAPATHLGVVPIAIGGALLLHATASFLHAAVTARLGRKT